MSKGFNFWGTAQNRRAQCLSMAIVHTGGTCTDDDVDSVIETAALFEDYIISGTKPAVGNGQPAGNSEPFLDTPADTTAAGEAKTAADDQSDTDAGAVSEIESEKRTVEQMLAHLAQFGLRLESQKIADDGVDLYWKGRIPDSPLSAMIAKEAAEGISWKLGKLFRAGHVCAVHYDQKGFPCVSWSLVDAEP